MNSHLQDSLDGTSWDVILSGTGIHQSLLALALSRSSKKVLHVDVRNYYGGAEASFSLQEADEWIGQVESENDSTRRIFRHASITRQDNAVDPTMPKLSFSRAYSVSLAPQLLYTQSELLRRLVSSGVHRQLEFVAMGSWWIYSTRNASAEEEGVTASSPTQNAATLVRVPSSREDVAFSDGSIDLRAKRAVMKVLRFMAEYEEHGETWQPYATRPLVDFLSEVFRLPAELNDLFLALTLSEKPRSQTTTAFSLPRIARHLRSLGRLGPGFSSLIPKWGGLSEIIQVSCRAGAVGGFTYVLGKDIRSFEPAASGEGSGPELEKHKVILSGGEKVTTSHFVGSENEGFAPPSAPTSSSAHTYSSRLVSIVDSNLPTLFPSGPEGSPAPGGSLVIFPSGSLNQQADAAQRPPIYLIIHNGETGECPADQCILYTSVAVEGPEGTELVNTAVNALLGAMPGPKTPSVLWAMNYQQRHSQQPEDTRTSDTDKVSPGDEVNARKPGSIINFSPSPSDLAFNDRVLEDVFEAWKKIVGGDAEADEFMVFPERYGETDYED